MIMTATEMNRGKVRSVFFCLLCVLLLDVGGGELRDETGGCLRRTISPVCEGPWRGRGTLMGAGCCCLLRSNSSYTLDMCHAAWPQNRMHMTLALGSFLTLLIFVLFSSIWRYDLPVWSVKYTSELNLNAADLVDITLTEAIL